MIYEDTVALKKRIECVAGKPVQGDIHVTDDTSEYMDIVRGMVLRLEGRDYYVTGDAREGRFGISDQPKFWVKYATDLESGDKKVIKLVFYEEFTTRLGRIVVRNYRSPEKESAVLELVRGHPNFMQGRPVRDAKNNLIRVIDLIKGKNTLFTYIAELEQDHETYFFETFPRLLPSIVTCIRAIAFLNENGLQHGDIRNDHIFIDPENGNYRWIDFDYAVNYPDYDLWTLGNILIYASGKGIHSMKGVQSNWKPYPLRVGTLTDEDCMLFYKYRIANLKKLYPYIPRALNNILLKFSAGTTRGYEQFDEVIEELEEVRLFFI